MSDHTVESIDPPATMSVIEQWIIEYLRKEFPRAAIGPETSFNAIALDSLPPSEAAAVPDPFAGAPAYVMGTDTAMHLSASDPAGPHHVGASCGNGSECLPEANSLARTLLVATSL